MRNRDRIDGQWETPTKDGTFNWEHVQVEVLMDIRDQMKKLNCIICCKNFLDIPRILRTIRANTTKRKRHAKK